jgi:rhodanese-related sulfurtransferase
MKKLLILSILLMTGLTACSRSMPDNVVNHSPENFQTSFASHENALLIDIRTAEEFEIGHIEGALNIDFYKEDFKNSILSLDFEGPVYVYCASGNRSSQAIKVFEEANFEKIHHLESGIGGWKNNELPLKTE